MSTKDYRNEVNEILDRYELIEEDKRIFWNIIEPIFVYKEFQKRLDAEVYPHHDKTSLGNHIISDAVVTYKLAKKAKQKNNDINIELAVIIAMFHDLYELPWQNAGRKKSMFVNKHGFIHPIEAIINAATWFPEYFKDLEMVSKIVDGVIHHMFPFPVRRINEEINKLELNNTEKFNNLSPAIKNLIINSSNMGLIKSSNISLVMPYTIEGRLMSKADTIVSLSKDATSLRGLIACITGKNSNLDNYQKVKKKVKGY